MKKPPRIVPTSTYRLQFNRHFTFDQARSLLDYFEDLGVGACYTSPVFKSKSGSEHGYDVVDHQTLNAELGGESGFRRFAESAKRRKIGVVLDVVPNHMYIGESANPWWNDVLENGSSSPYASCFDIDWHPPKAELANKILLPELGDQYGRELENKRIQIAYGDGAFQAKYFGNSYPIAPRSFSLIVDMIIERTKNLLSENDSDMLELQSIRTAIHYLPSRNETDPEKIKERYREKEIIGKRLIKLLGSSSTIARAMESALKDLNGVVGNPRSFDNLEVLLNDQVYRLCHWKVAADEINYRRFFDVNSLAAIRIEEPQVFDQVHSLLFKLIQEGLVSGLRVDHVDGLLDPLQYLEDLQQKSRLALANDEEFFVVVEKILMDKERLRNDWRAEGTTGYDFLNLVNGIFVERSNKRRFVDLYSRFSGLSRRIEDVYASCKKLIMSVSMSSELMVLSSRLDRISEQHRWSRDFTFESLRSSLREVIAHFPAYRSYIRRVQTEPDPEDQQFIMTAIQRARRKNPATSASVFDFIQDVLLLKDPEGLTDEQVEDRRRFVLHFQQITGPVTAKGIEDTAFYRYFPLASLDEVGGDPDVFGKAVEEFHTQNQQRQRDWPNALLATTTHDTKRSEDARARINVLSEIPTKWYRSLLRWRALNETKKVVVNGYPTPDANEEYLFYQTLLATWPFAAMDLVSHQRYKERISHYMLKALKEAKVHTSWINPNQKYEEALIQFIDETLKLSPDNQFLKDFIAFQKPIAQAGMLNSLAQLVLKMTSPGVPDFYQGTETWNFTLVDPDNRQTVDYKTTREWLAQIRRDEQKDPVELAARLIANMEDGRIKLFVTAKGLDYRKREPALFLTGSYGPLKVEGPRANNVCAFARVLDGKMCVSIVTRFHLSLNLEQPASHRIEEWRDTDVIFDAPPAPFMNIFTSQKINAALKNGAWRLSLADILGTMSVAILESDLHRA